jgi:Fuc2NAc and GlcNAc transferase
VLEAAKLLMVAALGTWLLGYPAKWLGWRLNILDLPGHRSSHHNPTPRTGGLSILFGLVAAVAMLPLPPWPTLPLGGLVLALAALGFLDDIFSLPVSVRFVVQFAVGAAAAWLFCGRLFGGADPSQPLYWASFCFSTLFIVTFINFFNFMDGINGLACSQGIIGGVAIAAMILLSGGSACLAGIAAALAGACLGFLPHNFPRAGIFMGDAGSMVLGFLLAVLGLMSAGDSFNAWIALVLPLGVFIYDPVFTVVKRLLRRKNVAQAHREHHYQLLIQCGWSHARVTFLQCGLMILCVGGGVVYLMSGVGGRVGVLAALLATAVGYTAFVRRCYARNRRPGPAQPGKPQESQA